MSLGKSRLEHLLLMAAEVTDACPAAKPILDKTLKFQGVGSQGRPRFPVFKGLRDIRDLAA